ncbi:MAG: hypothetical protein WCJ84_02465 [Candidatus Peregrinibacteria bacterium]
MEEKTPKNSGKTQPKELEKEMGRKVCKNCGKAMKKNGKEKSGSIRYRCNTCGKSEVTEKMLSIEKDVIHYGIDYLRLTCPLYSNDKKLEKAFPKDCRKVIHDDGGHPFGVEQVNLIDLYTKKEKYVEPPKYSYHTEIDFSVINKMEHSYDFAPEILFRLIPLLDRDNKNEATVNFLCYEWKVSRMGDFYQFRYDGEQIFAFRVIQESEKRRNNLDTETTYLRFDFYGTPFALGRMGAFGITNFLKDFGKQFPQKRVTRLDYCMDFKNKTVQEIADHFFARGTASSTYWDKDQNAETMYYGEYQNRKNKRQLTRLYDKKKQARENGLQHLYLEYMAFDDVTRFEIEIRSAMLREYEFQFDWIFDEQKMLGIFKNCCQNSYKDFKIDLEKIKKVKLSKKAGRKALETYFTSRIVKPWEGALRCGIQNIEILSGVIKQSPENCIQLLQSEIQDPRPRRNINTFHPMQ